MLKEYKKDAPKVTLHESLLHSYEYCTVVVCDRTGNKKEDLCSVVVGVFEKENNGGYDQAVEFCKSLQLHPAYFSITRMREEMMRSERIEKPIEILEDVLKGLDASLTCLAPPATHSTGGPDNRM